MPQGKFQVRPNFSAEKIPILPNIDYVTLLLVITLRQIYIEKDRVLIKKYKMYSLKSKAKTYAERHLNKDRSSVEMKGEVTSEKDYSPTSFLSLPLPTKLLPSEIKGHKEFSEPKNKNKQAKQQQNKSKVSANGGRIISQLLAKFGNVFRMVLVLESWICE